MKKVLNIFSIIIAIVGFIFVGLNIYMLVFGVIKGLNDSISLFLVILPNLVAIPFVLMELKDGVSLIRTAVKGETHKLIKPNAQLSISILGSITAGVLSSLVLIIYKAIEDGTPFTLLSDPKTTIGIFILILGLGVTAIFKSNAYLPLCIVSIAYAIVGFVYAYMIGYVESADILEVIANSINLVLLLLVVIFSIMSIIFYVTHKEELQNKYDEELEYDVVKEYKNGKAKIRVYQERPAEGSRLTKIFLIIGCLLFLVFIGLALFNSITSDYFEQIDFFTNSFGALSSLFRIASLLSLATMLPLVIIVVIGLIRNNSSFYFYLIAFVSYSRYFFLLYLSAMIEVMTNNSGHTITNLILISVPFIIALIFGAIGKNCATKCHDALKKGDSFRSTSAFNGKATIFYLIFSILITLLYVIFCITACHNIDISIFPFMIAITLITIGVVRSRKHNLEESFYVIYDHSPKETKATLPQPELAEQTLKTEEENNLTNKVSKFEDNNSSSKQNSKIVKILIFSLLLIAAGIFYLIKYVF